MTPLQVLAVCRDEWRGLHWRWEPDVGCAVGRAGRRDVAYVVVCPDGTVFADYDDADGRSRCSPIHSLDASGIRAAMREARRLVKL